MKVIYIKELNQYVLADGIFEINYDQLSFSINDVWRSTEEEALKYFTVIDVHTSTHGRLVHNHKDKLWEWHVFDRPRKIVGVGFMGEGYIYENVEVIERIPLLDIRKRQ